jgi:hypothetical protein
MVTIHRSSGLRFVIFKDDHEPAHVHVFGDGEMKVNLVGPGGSPELIGARGMARADIRRVMSVVVAERLIFLKRWKDIHG